MQPAYIYHYVNDPHVQIVLAEAGGKGIETGMTAATIALGKMGIIHGSRTYVIQNEDGQIEEPYSISAGLDYPGIGLCTPTLPSRSVPSSSPSTTTKPSVPPTN